MTQILAEVDWSNTTMAICTVAMTLIAAGSLVYTRKARGDSKDSAESSRRSADASEISAKAAQRSIELQEDATKRRLTARLHKTLMPRLTKEGKETKKNGAVIEIAVINNGVPVAIDQVYLRDTESKLPPLVLCSLPSNGDGRLERNGRWIGNTEVISSPQLLFVYKVIVIKTDCDFRVDIPLNSDDAATLEVLARTILDLNGSGI